MAFEAVVLDFDGTLTRIDVLDYLAQQTVDRGKQSELLRKRFQAGLMDGRDCLIERVGLLRGLDIALIDGLLGNHLLLAGYEVLQEWLRKKSLTVLLISGNICPVVEYFQRDFGARKVFCSKPTVKDGRIVGLERGRIGKRLRAVKAYLSSLGVSEDRVVVVGDDWSDRPFFGSFGWSIAFNGPAPLDQYARQSMSGDLKDLTAALDALIDDNLTSTGA